MIKYILCILLGVVLTSEFGFISDNDSQKFRTEAGTVVTQSCTSSKYYAFKAVVKQSYETDSSFGDEQCNYKISDGISVNSFFSRNVSPSKTQRFNIASAAIRFLSSLRSQLPEVKRTETSSYANLTKSSSRYYIYVLRRILI